MHVIAAAFRWGRRFLLLIVVTAMLALNVATLTVPAVASFAAGMVSAAGLNLAVTPPGKARAARRVVRRLGGRVARGAARNVGSMAAESLPWIGAAAVVGFTALELKDACETMKDLRELEAASGGGGSDGDLGVESDRVCGMAVPSREELAEEVVKAPGRAWRQAQAAADGALPEIAVDWTDYQLRLQGWLCSFSWNPFCNG